MTALVAVRAASTALQTGAAFKKSERL